MTIKILLPKQESLTLGFLLGCRVLSTRKLQEAGVINPAESIKNLIARRVPIECIGSDTYLTDDNYEIQNFIYELRFEKFVKEFFLCI